jgi:hypothetical protein
MPLFRRARCALPAFALATAAFALPATAAPQISQGTYIDTVSRTCTPTGTICPAVFGAVPAGKTMIIHNIACKIAIPSTASIRYTVIGGNNRSTFIEAGTHIIVGSTKEYVFETDTYHPLLAGQSPIFFVFSQAPTPNISITCTIAGELRP